MADMVILLQYPSPSSIWKYKYQIILARHMAGPNHLSAFLIAMSCNMVKFRATGNKPKWCMQFLRCLRKKGNTFPRLAGCLSFFLFFFLLFSFLIFFCGPIYRCGGKSVSIIQDHNQRNSGSTGCQEPRCLNDLVVPNNLANLGLLWESEMNFL